MFAGLLILVVVIDTAITGYVFAVSKQLQKEVLQLTSDIAGMADVVKDIAEEQHGNDE